MANDSLGKMASQLWTPQSCLYQMFLCYYNIPRYIQLTMHSSCLSPQAEMVHAGLMTERALLVTASQCQQPAAVSVRLVIKLAKSTCLQKCLPLHLFAVRLFSPFQHPRKNWERAGICRPPVAVSSIAGGRHCHRVGCVPQAHQSNLRR